MYRERGIRIVMYVTLACAIVPAAAQENPALHPHDSTNNWGKWGSDDEKGATNYTRPQDIVNAASLIRKGKTFSLAIGIEADAPRFPTRNPSHHFMVSSSTDTVAAGTGDTNDVQFTDDYIYMALQGSTQWDSLAHAYYGGSFYNGFGLDVIRTTGAVKLGIERVKDRFVGRGVLIDIVRYKGGSLEKGYGITLADIKGALAKQGTTVKQGDIVILRTGEVPAYYTMTPEEKWRWASVQTGITKDVVPWIRDTKIAAIAADNLGLEQAPNADGRDWNLHGNILRDLGVFIGELWYLEELAEDCAADGRYEFFLSAPPLNIPGAVGSPLNPIAVK